MACFIVPVAQAAVTTVVTKIISIKENKEDTKTGKIKLSKKLKCLSNLLWGGSAMLAFEHLWHGEIQPFYPFLTAASDPESARIMLDEMATNGVGMSVFVTAVWAVGVLVSNAFSKKAEAQKIENVENIIEVEK